MVGVVRDGDCAVVGLHDVVDEAESDAGAGDFGVAVAAIEALEDFCSVAFGDAGAGVGDDELYCIRGCACGEGNGAGGGSEFEGVVEEVEKKLTDGEGIEVGGEVGGEVDGCGEGVLLLLEVGLDEGDSFGEEGGEVGGLEVIELCGLFRCGRSRGCFRRDCRDARSRWR